MEALTPRQGGRSSPAPPGPQREEEEEEEEKESDRKSVGSFPTTKILPPWEGSPSSAAPPSEEGPPQVNQGSWGTRSYDPNMEGLACSTPPRSVHPEFCEKLPGRGGGAPTVTYNRLSHPASPQSTGGSLETKRQKELRGGCDRWAQGRARRGSPGLAGCSGLRRKVPLQRPQGPAPLTRHLGMGMEAGPAARGGAWTLRPRPSPRPRPRAHASPRASRRRPSPALAAKVAAEVGGEVR